MNILHIGKFYPPFHGGMETYLRDLAESQAKQGHNVVVLVHNHDWKWLKSKTFIEEKIPGLTIIRQACLRPVLFTPLMLGINKQVKHLLEEKAIDIVHLHVPNPSLFMLLFNRSAKKIPWVMRWHSDMVTESSSRIMRFIYRLIKPFETALINNSQFILTSTPEYSKKSPQLQKHGEQVKVIPLGLNVAKLPVPKVKSLTDEPFRVFSLGRLSYYKNYKLLIAAMQRLPDMHLTIAGGGDLYSQLMALIQSFDMSDRVTLTGPVSEHEKDQLFADCHLFCLASNDRAESYGMVLLEAMVRHKIILSADTEGSGMRWLAERYSRGLTFKNENMADLVAKLQYVRDNYLNLIQQPVTFDLTIEETSRDIIQLYQQLLIKESL